MKMTIVLAVFLFSACHSCASAATLAVSDVDGNYNSEGSWGVIGPVSLSNPGTRAAFPFTLSPGPKYLLDQIGVAALHESWGNEYSVKLYTGHEFPLALAFESYHRALPQGADNSTHAATSYFEFPAATLLEGGTKYWISLENLVNGDATWARSDTVLGEMARITSPKGSWFFNGPNDPQGSFIVLGQPVPEPTTLLLCCCSLALLPARRW